MFIQLPQIQKKKMFIQVAHSVMHAFLVSSLYLFLVISTYSDEK